MSKIRWLTSDHTILVAAILILLLCNVTGVRPYSVLEVAAQEEDPEEPTIITPETEIDWPSFWRKFKNVVEWDLQYLDGSWNSRKDLLHVIRDYANETCKITLNFTSDQAGSYRLLFAISQKVSEYVNRSSIWQYAISFKNFSLTFDWSDLKDVPGLTFRHGIKNDYFYFRIIKENVPADRSFSLDPTIIASAGVIWSTRYGNQIKTFRNPRGTQWYYALIYDSGYSTRELELYKSESGTSAWGVEAQIKTWGMGATQYESSSLWIHDNGSALIVYFVWTETTAGDFGLHYRRGVIADSGSTMALEASQKIATANYQKPVITLANDGYLWITTTKSSGGSHTYDVSGYNEVVCEWTKFGSSPYLHAGTSNYVYTAGKPDEVYEFTFADMIITDEPAQVILAVKGNGDGGDYVECYLHDGSSWSSNYDITPPAVAAFETVDVSAFLDTNTKVDNAKLKLIKKSSGSSNDLYVKEAELRVSSGYASNLTVFASDVTYEPTVSDWSNEELVFGSVDAGVYGWLASTIAPCNATRDVVIGFRNNDTGSPRVSMVEGDWNGATFTFQTVENLSAPLTSYLFNYRASIRIAVDVNNLVHVAITNDSTPAYCEYVLGSGFGTLEQVSTKEVISVSMSIDLTHTENRICIIYTGATVGTNDIHYKNQTVGEFDWLNGEEETIVDPYAYLYYLSMSYRDVERQVQGVYMRSYGGFQAVWFAVTTSTAPAIDDDYFVWFTFYLLLFPAALVILAVRRKRKNGSLKEEAQHADLA